MFIKLVRIGKDAELKQSQSGKPFLNFLYLSANALTSTTRFCSFLTARFWGSPKTFVSAVCLETIAIYPLHLRKLLRFCIPVYSVLSVE